MGKLAALVLLMIGAAFPFPVSAQEILRQVPELVAPEPHETARTRAGARRINFPVDPAALEQNLSVPLSEACNRLDFNQVTQGKYYVLVPNPDRAPRRFGFANGEGANLHDPKRLRGPNQVYLFYRDGTSQCRVYAFAR